jgi:hypothetical protein
MLNGVNFAIVSLREQLVKDCNESGLPIKVIELVLKDLYMEVGRQALLVVEQERNSAQEDQDDAG